MPFPRWRAGGGGGATLNPTPGPSQARPQWAMPLPLRARRGAQQSALSGRPSNTTNIRQNASQPMRQCSCQGALSRGGGGRACAWEAVTIKGMAWPASPVATGCQGNPCSTGIRWGVSPAAQMGCLRNTSREGEKDIWWTARTARGGTGHLGLTHRNAARQAMDGLWTEARGQQKQSNDPGNNQHILNTPIIGRR